MESYEHDPEYIKLHEAYLELLEKHYVGEATWTEVENAEFAVDMFVSDFLEEQAYADDLDYRCQCSECTCHAEPKEYKN